MKPNKNKRVAQKRFWGTVLHFYIRLHFKPGIILLNLKRLITADEIDFYEDLNCVLDG